MEDELDQLIENLFASEDDAPVTTEDDESPDSPAAIGEEAAPEGQEGDEGADDDDGAGSQDDALPGSPDGTGQHPAMDPEVEKLQRTVQSQTEFIRTVIANASAEKARQAEAAKAQEEADKEKALRDRWDRMDPDDARQEEVRWIAERAAERQKALDAEIEQLRQQITERDRQAALAEEAAAEAAARMEVLDILTERYSLTAAELEDLEDYTDPYTMEKYAQRAQSRRKGQTSAAREAKRQQLESNPALRGGDVGNGAPPPPKKVAESVDELVDNLFASLGR